MELISRHLASRGWFIFPEFIRGDLIGRMIKDLEKSYNHCKEIQNQNGVINSEGTCHHLIGQGDSFLECLSQYEKIDCYLEEYFGGKYILNSFGGNLLTHGSYANDIHRDIRSFSGSLPLMLNTIVMLDDFTKENGATWLMHRGHEWSDKPTESDFEKQSFQVTGSSGSIVIFNSNLWHRAGINTTDKPRRSVTPEFTRPFIKQGFDYPRALGENNHSPYLHQVLGYNSRTPQSLDEWYRIPEKRFYKGDQG